MRFALIGLAAAMVASGCDVVTRVSSSGEDGTIEVKGPQTTKSESLSNLSGVSAGEVFTVDVTIGGKPGVTLDAPKDLLPHITTKVENGILELGTDTPFSLKGNQSIKAHVVVSSLTYASISGAGSMTVNSPVSGTNLEAEASGASKLKFSANVDSLKVTVSGSSEVSLDKLNAKKSDIGLSGSSKFNSAGKVDDLTVVVSGASQFEGGKLAAIRAQCEASGASTIETQASDTLKASASGASHIKYRGNPKVEQDSSGVSNIEKTN